MQIAFKMKWISARVLVAVVVLTSVFTTSCRNMFSELADRESDRALHYHATMLLNQRAWDDAIDVIENQISASYATRREVRRTLAEAYIGRCGLEYVDLSFEILNAVAADSPMDVALAHMSSNTDFSDCLTAENIMRLASPAGDGIMSDNENDAFFMAFISLAKIGAILADDTTGADADTNNDGVVDGGFDGCAITDALTREIGSAMTLLKNNLENSGSDIATELGSFDTVCSDPAVTAAGTCDKTDPADFNATDLDMLRGVVNYSAFGVGSDVAYTICP
jgi:hypothetical protein